MYFPIKPNQPTLLSFPSIQFLNPSIYPYSPLKFINNPTLQTKKSSEGKVAAPAADALRSTSQPKLYLGFVRKPATWTKPELPLHVPTASSGQKSSLRCGIAVNQRLKGVPHYSLNLTLSFNWFPFPRIGTTLVVDLLDEDKNSRHPKPETLTLNPTHDWGLFCCLQIF